MRVLDGSFSPATLTVTVGDTVTWINADDSPHTATADSGAFDSGNLDAGAVFSFTFTEPGTYRYVCSYHDEMVGTITVVAAATDADTSTPTAPAVSTPAQHGGGQSDQPNTALPVEASAPAWLPTLLIGLGLVAFAFALVPAVQTSAARSSERRAGWRR